MTEIHAEPRALVDGHRPTDVGNSSRLVAVADGRIRYVRQWDKYIVYRDGTWLIDGKNVLVTRWAKQACRLMFEFAVRPEVGVDQRDALIAWAKASESAARINAMIALARDVPGVLVEHTELDQRHELLNVLNGTVDLRTGELRPHDPEHLITKQVPVTWDPTAESPEWDRCLAEWQPDAKMRTYLQELIGAGATGYTPELFCIHLGDGGNGKGKFFGQLMYVLGPYAVVPHKSLLVAQRHEQHETVMTDLAGARLAVAAETDRGARLDEGKIKELTGADKLRGRRMREDAWEFWPTHTPLHLHTNHAPKVTGTDEGIWRRIDLIPWEATIAKPDPELAAKLREEAAGTLNWVVAGAQRWLANDQRFSRPDRVVQASDRYREDADALWTFFRHVVVDGDDFTATDALHEAHVVWRTDPRHPQALPMISKDALAKYARRRYQPATKRVEGRLLRGFRGLAIHPSWVQEIERVRREEPHRLGDQTVDFTALSRGGI